MSTNTLKKPFSADGLVTVRKLASSVYCVRVAGLASVVLAPEATP